jgi:hypothetical protein
MFSPQAKKEMSDLKANFGSAWNNPEQIELYLGGVRKGIDF